jgi:hypothetical protein
VSSNPQQEALNRHLEYLNNNNASLTQPSVREAPQIQETQFNHYQGNSLGDASNFYRDSMQNQIDAQTAKLNQAYINQITQLEKAYADAVAEGKISVRDAEAQFEDQKREIYQQSYRQSESTKVYGNEMGIQNSQQMIGLQQGNQAREMNMINRNMTDRDRRINDIRDRINSITLQRDLSIAAAQYERDYGIVGATADAYSQYNQQMGGLLQQDYFNRQAMEHDKNMFDWKAEFDKMMAQQQHEWDLDKMDIQQRNILEQMAIAHGYDLEKMDKQQLHDLAKMAKSHEYDMIQINQQFKNNVSLENLKHTNNMKVTAAQFNNAKKLATHNANIAKANAKSEYETARARELAKYTPGTPEYKIRQSQLDEQFSIMEREIETRAMTEALVQARAGNIGKSSSSSSAGGSGSGGFSSSRTNIYGW